MTLKSTVIIDKYIYHTFIKLKGKNFWTEMSQSFTIAELSIHFNICAQISFKG